MITISTQSGNSTFARPVALLPNYIYICSHFSLFRLPSSSDAARKRMLADFVVKHKKQVVKLYAVVKWAKDARDIQLCMVKCSNSKVMDAWNAYLFIISQNIVSFLLEVNNQFHQVTDALETIKLSLAAAKSVSLLYPRTDDTSPLCRLRNHDLLTSLDLLTTGTYQRLPTGIKVSSHQSCDSKLIYLFKNKTARLHSKTRTQQTRNPSNTKRIRPSYPISPQSVRNYSNRDEKVSRL